MSLNRTAVLQAIGLEPLNNRATVLALIALAYSLLTWALPLVLPPPTVAYLVSEDSPIEYIASLGFFISALCWFGAFLWSRSGNRIGRWQTRRNYLYLLLALILLFGAGEEISWGQRILGFETPEFFQEENEQEEFSIHNLPFFNTTDIGNLFQMNRMFLYFWFTLGILIPVGALLFRPLRDWFVRLGVPIIPLVLGGLFLYNYVASKLYDFLIDEDIMGLYDGRTSEIRESQEGVLFALIALWVLLAIRRPERATPEPQQIEQASGS